MNLASIHRVYCVNRAVKKAMKRGIMPDTWQLRHVNTLFTFYWHKKPVLLGTVYATLRAVGRTLEYRQILTPVVKDLLEAGYLEQSGNKYGITPAGLNWLKSFEKCLRDSKISRVYL